MKKVVFLDMDGVLANFEGALKEVIHDPPEMFQKDFFLNLEPMEGSKEFVDWAFQQDYLRLYIGSKPAVKNLWSTIEKYWWIEKHFPKLLKKMVLVCDKGLLRGDVLVDDDHARWGHKFHGLFFHFDRNKPKEEFERLKAELSKFKPETKS